MKKKIKEFFRSDILPVAIYMKIATTMLLLGVSWANAAGNTSCEFISNINSTVKKPVTYKAHKNDTYEAKSFYKTCNNPYTERFAKDANAALAGKKSMRDSAAYNAMLRLDAALAGQPLTMKAIYKTIPIKKRLKITSMAHAQYTENIPFIWKFQPPEVNACSQQMTSFKSWLGYAPSMNTNKPLLKH